MPLSLKLASPHSPHSPLPLSSCDFVQTAPYWSSASFYHPPHLYKITYNSAQLVFPSKSLYPSLASWSWMRLRWEEVDGEGRWRKQKEEEEVGESGGKERFPYSFVCNQSLRMWTTSGKHLREPASSTTSWIWKIFSKYVWKKLKEWRRQGKMED